MTNTIGQRIKEKRIAAGLGQKELAEMLGGCSASYISAVERGATEISREQAEKFATILGCSASALIGTARTRGVGMPGHESNNESYRRYAEIRDARGLCDRDVALSAGITPSVITHWKLYGTNPKEETLRKIGKVLHTDPERFVTEGEEDEDITMMLSPAERDVLYKYRVADETTKKKVEKILGISQRGGADCPAEVVNRIR